MNNICFVSNKYPNVVNKNGLVFVQQLVWALADLNVKCTVICPLAFNLNPRYLKVPYHVVEKTDNNSLVDVYFPKFFGLGQSHYVLGRSPAPVTTELFTNSVIKTLKKNRIAIDAVYGHFAAPAGICAARVGHGFNVPSFMAYGESTSWSIDQFGAERMREEFKSLSGVIAVSTRNKELLLEKNIIEESKIRVFPNGYRSERFYKINKKIARKKLGWEEDKYIVGMVGSLIERKGPLRLQKAVEQLDNVYFACAGKGNQVPKGEKCIFAGPIDNNELLYFYNALDVFVLPTLNEGCCNALVEAIACGCPIISSNLSFNDDILDDTYSIRINPNSVEEISKAIESLEDSGKRLIMSEYAIKKSKDLKITARAGNILNYIYGGI